MNFLDLTLPSSPENLACDEVLLDACDESVTAEVLRFWEPKDCFVVVGYSNEVEREVNLAHCRKAGIGVFRRCSGGGTVLQAPGCLNYSLALRIDGCPSLETITSANKHIMERQRAALAGLLNQPVEINGCTDLAIANLKFSGNAQRRKRRALLFHGTFLLTVELDLMNPFLKMPSRQPEYRAGRPHDRFLMNLEVPTSTVKAALRDAWSAHLPLLEVPDCRKLAADKYARDEWNLKF